jgi:hypothetical protein
MHFFPGIIPTTNNNNNNNNKVNFTLPSFTYSSVVEGLLHANNGITQCG